MWVLTNGTDIIEAKEEYSWAPGAAKNGGIEIVPGRIAYPIPDQEVPVDVKLTSLKQYDATTANMIISSLIDQWTGRAINAAIHPLASIEEQVGILRVQIGEILNAIGFAPTAGFDHLNTIAAEKIQEAAAKKEAL